MTLAAVDGAFPPGVASTRAVGVINLLLYELEAPEAVGVGLVVLVLGSVLWSFLTYERADALRGLFPTERSWPSDGDDHGSGDGDGGDAGGGGE
ncbi:hypothetical protein OJ997_28445 [Solirubrobacter phytolaccae]|uniref:Uncharacterized protein n=1 Tax=Solirubrobacter phytolaccae TaxID=1404360 RepID=A0A9X3NMQ3_9ACTN|nr:hypothetical protein [Solirubrobacter phytolaccae]MDA0184272.1 hypothetical protein [Solirubrobacter phytolaccae]